MPLIVLTVLGLVGGTVMDVYSAGLNLPNAGLRFLGTLGQRGRIRREQALPAAVD